MSEISFEQTCRRRALREKLLDPWYDEYPHIEPWLVPLSFVDAISAVQRYIDQQVEFSTLYTPVGDDDIEGEIEDYRCILACLKQAQVAA